jgi:hypothetical protein
MSDSVCKYPFKVKKKLASVFGSLNFFHLHSLKKLWTILLVKKVYCDVISSVLCNVFFFSFVFDSCSFTESLFLNRMFIAAVLVLIAWFPRDHILPT